MKKLIILEISFILGFLFVFGLGLAFAKCTDELIIYNRITNTKVAIQDTCGRINAITNNDDLVVGGRILVPWYSVLIADLPEEKQIKIKMPSVINL